MDWRLASAQRCAAALREHTLNLRHDRKRDFLGCFCTKVETGWSEQLRVDLHAVIEQRVQKLVTSPAWSEQPGVTQVQREQVLQSRVVAAVVM